ncbi:hypothetical protein C4572_02160 [Candidatus Parcubacteria bacterium]|nr:MAG: hypothetical protein C4572_02160 [Candidatus Parcubacteria bacterium]
MFSGKNIKDLPIEKRKKILKITVIFIMSLIAMIWIAVMITNFVFVPPETKEENELKKKTAELQKIISEIQKEISIINKELPDEESANATFQLNQDEIDAIRSKLEKNSTNTNPIME